MLTGYRPLKTLKLNVLFLAAEADPLVKVGGLGDVAGSLPPALQQLTTEKTRGVKLDVRLVIPFHSVIRQKHLELEYLFEYEVPSEAEPIIAQAYRLLINGVEIYLISGAPFREDAPVYDPNPAIDGLKFFFFSLAALELVKKLDWQPDILHANDWHTAIAVYALKVSKSHDPFFKDVASVLTIHNLLFMGAGTEAALDVFGFPASQSPDLPWWAKKFPLPLGLETAERIVPVSPTYAREILTPEYGGGLDEFLKTRQESITGIVNGIDQVSWNPATDPAIRANFDISTLFVRQNNKEALTAEFSLNPDPKIPLLILIARMDQQKGVDLAVNGLSQMTGQRWQAIILGTGSPEIEDACRQMEREHPERVRAAIRFDSRLARRMYAGGDIILMPSRYEPCGLAQMIAMRYGCVPLARATGGLQDTIIDIADNPERGTGFLFKPATPEAFAETLHRALALFPDSAHWSAIQRQGMCQDFSWENSALQYVQLYQGLLKGRA